MFVPSRRATRAEARARFDAWLECVETEPEDTLRMRPGESGYVILELHTNIPNVLMAEVCNETIIEHGITDMCELADIEAGVKAWSIQPDNNDEAA